MGIFSGIPPLPTDSGPLPAPDVSPVNSYSPTTEATDTLNFLKGAAPDLKTLVSDVTGAEELFVKLMLALIELIGEGWIKLLGLLVPLQVDYNNALAALHKAELPLGVPASRDMIADELAIILAAIGSTATANYAIPGSDITAEGESLFTSLIEPFTLAANTADPSQFGSGFQNQHFLLKRALALSLAEYTLDSMKDLVGFGWVKGILPMLGFIDRAINPSNVVRQSMEQTYAFLMKTPIQRDLNNLYPIKDLGVAALAKTFLRGGIDQATYLQKALDSGLDNTQAQQLILETAKLLPSSDLGVLLNNGQITYDDMIQQLLQQGYPGFQATATTYLETHRRFFSIQDRVGNEAVTAWKHGYINQAQLETLLAQLNFTPDEIALLEIEGQFTKKTTEQKTLSSSQVKAMFDANIVDLNYAINFFTAEGYSPEDVGKIILLDFVKKEERLILQNELFARIRVEAQLALTAAATENKKNETALATARQSLAAELNATQTELGLLQAAPSILNLLGIAL